MRKPVVFLAGALALAGSPGASAEELPIFGMQGLARGQTATLNLVIVQPPDDDRPACRVTASFVDANGEVLRDAAGNAIEETLTLRPEVAAQLSVEAAEVLGRREQRKSIRPVLVSPPDDGTPSDCTCLVATRETVDSSGRTSASDYGQRPPGGGNPPPPPTLCQPGAR
jgi:hypothetical protein